MGKLLTSLAASALAAMILTTATSARADFICFCDPIEICCSVGFDCTPEVTAPRVIYTFFDAQGTEFASYDSAVDENLQLPIQLRWVTLPDGAFSVEYTGPDMRFETGGDCQDAVLEFADARPLEESKQQQHPGGRIPVTKVGNRSPVEGWNGAADWFKHYGRICRELPGNPCEWALQVDVEWVEGIDVVLPTPLSSWGVLKAMYD